MRVFRRNSALEDAVGSQSCSLEVSMRVTNGIFSRVDNTSNRLAHTANHVRNTEGHDAEAHAMVALLTGVVGIGDWQDEMTNGTLIRRLARSDGILLKADRPLALMDLQLAGMINGSRALCGALSSLSANAP
jgi:hypothetical protein